MTGTLPGKIIGRIGRPNVTYRANELSDDGLKSHGEYRCDEQDFVLCGHWAKCDNRAINYSGVCGDHGAYSLGPLGMTRLERFQRGFIGVEHLDFEELREAVTRSRDGSLRKTSRIPVDAYQQCVVELYQRHDEQMRGLLDKALKTLEEILDSPLQTTIRDEDGNSRTYGVPAGDKLRASQFVWQTIRGKMPETVNVNVDTKPFEELFSGIAKISREQSEKLARGEIIDAEVVADPERLSEPSEGLEADTEPPSAPADAQKPAQPVKRRRRRADPV